MAKAYGSIITNIGAAQMTNAALEGKKVNITHVAVGDSNGIEYMPIPDMTGLKHEVWRGVITDYSKGADQVIDIYGIIPASVGNFIIREMAAIDSDGNTIVLTNSPPIHKVTMDTGASLDLNIRIKIVVTNTDVLEFKIDPNVMTASMAKVIVKADKVIGATAGNLAKLNELGNLVDAGVSWEEIEAGQHSHTNKGVLDKITAGLIDTWNSTVSHITDAIKHIAGEERTLWNTVSDKADTAYVDALNPSDIGADPAGSAANALASAKQYTDTGLAGKANSSHTHAATYTATIGTAWSGSGPYTQTVAVVGILESDNPIADIVLSGITQTDTGRLEAWGMVSRMVTKADGITVTCLEDKPTVEMPIQIKVVR